MLQPSNNRLVEGNPDASVRVLIYEDLQCGDCAVLRKMLDDHLLPAYREQVAVEHRDFPLPKHSWARLAAVAARFFAQRDSVVGLEFRRYLLADFRSISMMDFGDRLREFAAAHGVDGMEAIAALGDADLQAAVEQDYQEGVARGVAKTPTVFIGENVLIEKFSPADLAGTIERALKEAA
ncbi:MAG: thioredoxin domain-containing protein [Bryobacterales bacterium]|nr:thioredoxin domain-containing protein [Bryobacterales bacterium]